MSCEKNDVIAPDVTESDISKSSTYSDGLFRKEIVVQDISGKNKAFYAIHSDDQALLSDYFLNNEFTLMINEGNVEWSKQNFETSQNQVKADSDRFNLKQEPKIFVELIRTNLQKDVQEYSLHIVGKNLKSTTYVAGYPVAYTTTNNFIGAVHDGSGSEFIAKLEYKAYWYTINWTYVEIGGVSSWTIDPDIFYHIGLDEDWDVYKRGIVIYPDYYQQGVNYHIAYSANDFKSRTCAVGTYDYNNYGECYVGTAPVGTTAFFYGTGSNRYAYYTPVSGNNCPLSGSVFDGLNCRYVSIPVGCTTYVWQRNWLVESEDI